MDFLATNYLMTKRLRSKSILLVSLTPFDIVTTSPQWDMPGDEIVSA